MNVNDEIRQAFVDVLDGTTSAKAIQEFTGLPIERCQQIYDLYRAAQMGNEYLNNLSAV